MIRREDRRGFAWILDILSQEQVEDLIRDAQETAAIHCPNSIYAKRRRMSNGFTISSIECACGCATLMPQNLVDMGWKFLRGHKSKGILHGTSAHQTGQEPQGRTQPATVINLKNVITFLRSEVEILNAHLKVKIAEKDALEKAILLLHNKAVQYQTALSSLTKEGAENV